MDSISFSRNWCWIGPYPPPRVALPSPEEFSPMFVFHGRDGLCAVPFFSLLRGRNSKAPNKRDVIEALWFASSLSAK
jgi:hypothetical protein